MGYRVGIDVGGTFTDLIAVQVETGQIVSTKVQSTPANPADGFIDSLVQSNIPSAEIDVIVHGTTVGTNALIERRGPKSDSCAPAGFATCWRPGESGVKSCTTFIGKNPGRWSPVVCVAKWSNELIAAVRLSLR